MFKKGGPGNVWFLDDGSPNIAYAYRVKEVLHVQQTRFQEVEFLDTYPFGKVLVINDRIQSAESDERVYHELLVMPALVLHPDPRTALVVGGGEGATLREILKRPSIEKVHMVDIDAELVELCKKYLPEWHQGSFEDPRVEVFYEDAFRFLRESDKRAGEGIKYDLIFIDLTEPGEADVSQELYSNEWYSLVKSRLNEGGIMVVQAGCADYSDPDLHRHIYETLGDLFKIVRPYRYFIPSFMAVWGFMFASDAVEPDLSESELESRFSSSGIKPGSLDFYSPRMHRVIFTDSPWHRRVFEGG